MMCPDCHKDYPRELGSELRGTGLSGKWTCAVCALSIVNRLHKLAPDTPFAGDSANAMYKRCLAYQQEAKW